MDIDDNKTNSKAIHIHIERHDIESKNENKQRMKELSLSKKFCFSPCENKTYYRCYFFPH